MSVFNQNILKSYMISVTIIFISVNSALANDLEVLALNYNCSENELKCELLIQNKSPKMLYVMSPENFSFNENQTSNVLIIKTFSEKNLNGDFSINLNTDEIPMDNPNVTYYSFFTGIKSNDFIVLFFDFKLTEFPFCDSSIRSFSDYDIVKIQSLYSENPEPNTDDKICISEFTIDLKTNLVKSFNVYDYVDKCDNSVVFIGNDKTLCDKY